MRHWFTRDKLTEPWPIWARVYAVLTVATFLWVINLPAVGNMSDDKWRYCGTGEVLSGEQEEMRTPPRGTALLVPSFQNSMGPEDAATQCFEESRADLACGIIRTSMWDIDSGDLRISTNYFDEGWDTVTAGGIRWTEHINYDSTLWDQTFLYELVGRRDLNWVSNLDWRAWDQTVNDLCGPYRP